MMKSRNSNGFWLALSLALMFLSGPVASLVQTSGGRVVIKEMRWETRSGKMLSALLFKPASATAARPAPAIIVGHGWWNNRGMQGPACLELARRGYVVLSIDMYGHGNSEPLAIDNTPLGATGMYDGVRLIADLPYVDLRKIGVSGHSHGARAANYCMEIDNAAEKRLIAAVMLVDDNPVYTDDGGHYANVYGERHVGLIADQYDEFYFRSYSPSGDVLTPPREYISTANAQSFLHFGADPAKFTAHRLAGEFYTKDTASRIVYTPVETHPWGPISQTSIASQIAFFEHAFGAPNPIAAHSQVWQIKEIFTTIGLLGFGIFLVAFTNTLLQTRFFERLKEETPVRIAPPRAAAAVWFFGGLLATTIIIAVSYVVFSNMPSIQGIAFNARPTIFIQGAVFFIAFWLALNGLATLLTMAIAYQAFGRQNGVNLRAIGVLPGWRKFVRGITLGVVVVASAYGIVFLMDYFFQSDFRLWLIAVKAFTPDKLPIALLYLPFFALYFMANSIALNCFGRVSFSGSESLNTVVLMLCNCAAPAVLIVAQYVTFFITGYTMHGFGGIFSIWLIPVLMYLAVSVLISSKIYRSTNNPYIGGFISAAVVTLMAVTNTLTVLY